MSHLSPPPLPPPHPPGTKRPTRPGRSSRRRKRKARSILDAAALLLSTDAASSSSTSLPTDRGTTLRGVCIRRREERRRRRPNALSHPTAEESNRAQTMTDDDCPEESLDPADERQLLSQLGFLPGNAVCVAARLSLEFTRDDGSGSNPSCGRRHRSPPPPSVLKLYPMVIRDSYRGGKTEGRKFKGRRRGCSIRDAAAAADETRQEMPELSPNTNIAAFRNHAIASYRERCRHVDPATTDSTSASTRPLPPSQPQIVEPFPTLYWLTSPHLRSRISRLELSETHNVARMEQRLRSSQSHLDQMAKAHTAYGTQRWELLTPSDREEVLHRGWGEALDRGRGVAGIRPRVLTTRRREGEDDCLGEIVWDGVKCLHAHAAHFLAQVEEWREKRLWQRNERGVAGACREQNCDHDDDDELLSTLMQECDRDDLNLVGKWTMEAVLDLLSTSQS